MSHCGAKVSCRGGGGCACGREVIAEIAAEVARVEVPSVEPEECA